MVVVIALVVPRSGNGNLLLDSVRISTQRPVKPRLECANRHLTNLAAIILFLLPNEPLVPSSVLIMSSKVVVAMAMVTK